MKKILRFLIFCVYSLLAIVTLVGAMFGYYVYTPASEVPRLSGTLTRGSVEVGGLKRTYLTYLPRGLAKEAPLLVVLHGSGESGAAIRLEMGYAFDRLADERGFAVVYPDARDGYWDTCSIAGAIDAAVHTIDDMGFLTGMVDKLITEIGADPGRVFAVGSSRGGSMALRLALEAPSRFQAVAAVSASVPTPENFKCKTVVQGTSSVMIMNGTEDPIVPFNGGEVSLFGLFYKNGRMLSSRESGQYIADFNHIAGAPEVSQAQLANGIHIEHVLWRDDSKVEVELVAIQGGGHGMPQPYKRRPRILGPSAMEPNGPEVIWTFFERQRS